jgi:hypothetical protein
MSVPIVVELLGRCRRDLCGCYSRAGTEDTCGPLLILVIVLLASGAAQWWLYRKNSSAYVPPSEFLLTFSLDFSCQRSVSGGQWRPADRAPGL